MTDKSISGTSSSSSSLPPHLSNTHLGGAAPPYDSNPPYSHTPAQPTMGLQHDSYNTQPSSPSPQTFPSQQTPNPTYPQQQQQQQQPPESYPQTQHQTQSSTYPQPMEIQHQHQPFQPTGQPYQGNGQPTPPLASPQYNDQQKGSYYGQVPQGAIPMQSPAIQHQQSQYPPVQHQQSQYHSAIPLQNLTEGAAPVDCPTCRQRALTRTDYVSGNTTM